MTLEKKIKWLSILSQETKGAAFVIQHMKSTGLFKVNFNNQFPNGMLEAQSFEKAIDAGIKWLTENRKERDVGEIYTLTDTYKV